MPVAKVSEVTLQRAARGLAGVALLYAQGKATEQVVDEAVHTWLLLRERKA